MLSVPLTCLLVAAAVILYRWQSIASTTQPPVRGDVLLVFAHPDDEAMFFTPFLMYLRRQKVNVHFLCLCNGNFEHLGKTRERELVESGAFFGVSPRNIRIVNHEQLQDGQQNKWAPAVVRKEIEQYLQKAGSISTIVTFDTHGVSGHANHIAVHKGAKLLKEDTPRGLIYLELRTHGLVPKYTGIVSLLPYFLLRRPVVDRQTFSTITPPLEVLNTWKAMQRHASQLVWFRYLFVMFSSYTYSNDFQELM